MVGRRLVEGVCCLGVFCFSGEESHTAPLDPPKHTHKNNYLGEEPLHQGRLDRRLVDAPPLAGGQPGRRAAEAAGNDRPRRRGGDAQGGRPGDRQARAGQVRCFVFFHCLCAHWCRL